MNSDLLCLQWPGILSAARVYDRRGTNHAFALVIRTTRSLELPTVKLREPVKLLPSVLFSNPNRVAQIGDVLNKDMGPQLQKVRPDVFVQHITNLVTLFGLMKSTEGRSLTGSRNFKPLASTIGSSRHEIYRRHYTSPKW